MRIYRSGVAIAMAAALIFAFYPNKSQPRSLTKFSVPQTAAKSSGLPDSLKTTGSDPGLGTNTVSVQSVITSTSQIGSSPSDSASYRDSANVTQTIDSNSGPVPGTAAPQPWSLPSPSPSPEPVNPPCNACVPGAGRVCPMAAGTETIAPQYVCACGYTAGTKPDYIACRLQ